MTMSVEQSAKFAAMIEAIRAAPQKRETWSVFGDFLSEQSDPRGELVALDLKLEETALSPSLKSALVERRSALMKTHADLLLGPERLLGDFYLHWRRGFIWKVISPRVTVHPDCLAALRTHPSAALLEEMEAYFDEAPVLFQGAFPSLQSLYLHRRSETGDRPLAPNIETACPNLVALHLHEPFEDLRHLQHRSLKRLDVSNVLGRFGNDFGGRFESLVSLSLFAHQNYDGMLELPSLLDGQVASTLRRLTLGNFVLTARALRDLIACFKCTAFERIELNDCELSPQALRAWFDVLEKMPRLKAFAPPRYRLIPSRVLPALKEAEQAYRARQRKKKLLPR